MSDNSHKNLKSSAIRGGAWGSASRIVRLLFQFASIAILARLLSPDDFGLVGTVAGAVAIVSMFRELGLSMAIVQAPDVKDEHLNCILKFTVYLGFVLLLVAGLLGLAVGWFFSRIELTYIAPFFGIVALLSSMEVVPLGLLRRNLEFSKIAIREISSTAIGTLAGIIAAWMGADYWALVIAPVTMQTTNTVLSWLTITWRPTATPFQWNLIKPYLKFGGTLTLGEFSNFLCQNLDILLIGKVWGFNPLGYYTRSRVIVANPINQIAAPMASVLTPVFSRMKEDPARQRYWIDSIFGAILVVGGISGAWLAACASDIVPLLLGDSWTSVSKLMFWMAPLVLFRPAGTVLYCFLMSTGKLKTLLSWTWIGSIITITSIIVSVPFGIEAVAGALSVAVGLRMFVAIYFCSSFEAVDFGRLCVKALVGIVHFVGLLILHMWIVKQTSVSEWNVILRLGFIASISAVVLSLWALFSKTWRELITQYTCNMLSKYRSVA